MRDAIPGQWDGLPDGFHDADMVTYLGWPLVGSSLCKKVRRHTPAYIRWALNGGVVEDETSAKRLGSVVHTAVFEPDFLDSVYAVMPEPDSRRHLTSKGEESKNPANTTAYREEVAAVQAANPGKALIPASVYAQAMEMRDAVHAHPLARKLIGLPGPVEQSIIATDPETGVRCKIRPDKLVDPMGANLQAKTTRNARWDVFSEDAFRFGYHISEAFYARMLRAAGWDFRHPFVLAIENEGPITADGIAVYEMDEGAMDAGDRLVSRYLRQIAFCFEHDTWPGHAQDTIPSLSLPPWAWQKVDEEENDPPAILPVEALYAREEAVA